MKTLQINNPMQFKIHWKYLLIPAAFVLIWFALPTLIRLYEPTAGTLDVGFLQLIFLAVGCYFGFVILCGLFLYRCWVLAGLPQIKVLVSHFKVLELWQQLSLLWASFALLLLAGIGCMAAVL